MYKGYTFVQVCIHTYNQPIGRFGPGPSWAHWPIWAQAPFGPIGPIGTGTHILTFHPMLPGITTSIDMRSSCGANGIIVTMISSNVE